MANRTNKSTKLMEYTAKEVQSNINVLKTNLESLLLSRKNLNSLISSNKKQIKYWEEFDLSQLKAF